MLLLECRLCDACFGVPERGVVELVVRAVVGGRLDGLGDLGDQLLDLLRGDVRLEVVLVLLDDLGDDLLHLEVLQRLQLNVLVVLRQLHVVVEPLARARDQVLQHDHPLRDLDAQATRLVVSREVYLRFLRRAQPLHVLVRVVCRHCQHVLAVLRGRPWIRPLVYSSLRHSYLYYSYFLYRM